MALVGFGAVAQLVQSDRTPLYGIGTDDEGRSLEPALLAGVVGGRHSAPILAPEDGFNAFTAKDPPPAELLALADWPLDPPRAASAAVADANQSEDLAAADEPATASHGEGTAADSGPSETRASAAVGVAGDERAPLEQLSPVTINPVASAAFPTVVEKDGRSVAAKGQGGEGIAGALASAFEASGRDKPLLADTAQNRPASKPGNADQVAGASVSPQQPGVTQVKTPGLLDKLASFFGVGGGDRAPKSAVAANKNAEHALEDIPAIPNERRAAALASGPTKTEVLGQERMLLSAASLDDMRGGFATDTGMKVFFGIERAVYINGNLVTTTALNVSDLASFAGKGVAQIESVNMNGVTLVRNGAGNTVETSTLTARGLGTIIQNRLDGQTIRTETTVNLATNSMQMLRNIEFVRSFRQN